MKGPRCLYVSRGTVTLGSLPPFLFFLLHLVVTLPGSYWYWILRNPNHQEVAKTANHLTVFQRTPTYTIPLRNLPLDPDVQRLWNANYPEFIKVTRYSPGGLPFHVYTKYLKDASPEEQHQGLQAGWNLGGFRFMFGIFNDIGSGLRFWPYGIFSVFSVRHAYTRISNMGEGETKSNSALCAASSFMPPFLASSASGRRS